MTKPTLDELRLAQLLSQDISNDKKLEILKDLDVTCTVSGKCSTFQENSAFLSYNCLHIAVISEHRRLKSDMDSLDLSLLQEMLSLGANVLQQDVRYGETPLHKAADYVKNYSGTSVWKLVGVLQEHRMVNTLLSAQVKSDNPFNATCKSGISHLHIACMFNHAEAVVFLARLKESLNQPISIDSNVFPGYTPMHCTIRYSSSESASMLLSLGANLYLENAEGMNSVCYLIERLLDANDYLKMADSSYSYPYEKEIERLDSIVKVLVLKYRSDDLQLVENTGLSAFHLACMLKDNWMMQTYITWDFKNINKPTTRKSKLWSGWTPLHFATCCNIQTLKVLLQNGADFKIKNTKGETALDFCLQRYGYAVPYSYMSVHTVLSDEVTKLSDLMFATCKYDTCQNFVQNLSDINITVPLDSIVWPGYNLLHMSLSMYHTAKHSHIFRQETDYCIKTGYTVNLPKNDVYPQYRPRIDELLKRGCSIYAKNADGLTPIHLALKLDEWYAVEELLAGAQKDVVGPNNVSFLHIACAMGKIDVVARLLKNGADVNSPVANNLEWYAKPNFMSQLNRHSKLRRVLVRKGSTPLHIAVIFETAEVIEKLLIKHADLHATDELGLTPLHLSLIASTKNIARLLLFGASNLREVKREDGLSHLHVAAFADDEEAVGKLLRDGADVNSFIRDTAPKCLARFVGKTPLHLAVEGEKAARVLIENGANILAENPNSNYDTPLDLAMRTWTSSIIFQKIKRDEARIDTLTVSGVTTLHIACTSLDLDWTRTLLRQGANPNAQMKDAEGQADTPMHLVIRNFTGNLRATFVELLLEYGADVTVISSGKTSLHLVADTYFELNWLSPASHETTSLAIADLLLSNQRSYVFNPTDTDGFSHFHFACMTNNLDVMKKYLDNGVDVNSSKCPFATKNGGYTPLHFAIAHKSMNAVRLLLKRGADVKAVDTNGNTPFHLTIMKGSINFQLLDVLLKKGADINAKNLKGETPIICLLSRKNVTHRQFHFLMNRGSTIDLSETIRDGQGIIGFALESTEPSDVESVLETLIRFSHLKIAINQGFMAIHNLVSVQRSKNLTCEHYLKAMQRLTENGSDIDEKDRHGKTALDIAISFHNLKAIEALLLLGADVNGIEDENGNSSVARSCRCSSWEKESVPFMRNHLWKMTLAKLDLNVSNVRAMRSGGWQPNDNDAQVYQTELEKMEHTNICQSLTVKHFLSEWRAVIGYPTMSVAKRQAVENFFKQTDDLREEFPEFAGILMLQYRKALARVKLMQPVKDILVAAGIDLPDLCLEAILKNFKNAELNFLIENADEMPRPCKRRKI